MYICKTEDEQQGLKFVFPKVTQNWMAEQIESSKSKLYLSEPMKKKTVWIKTENLIFKFPLPPDILSNVASVERPDKQAINEKKACLQICQL